MKVWARERYFIRIKDISKKAVDAIQSKYTFHFFEERACNQCEWVGLRRQQGLLGECEACAAYRGSALLATKVKVGENQYLATPLGDFWGLCKILKKYTAEDIRKVEKHPVIKIKPIKFTGEARGYQEEAVQSCINGEKGVLYAPPRSGKCLVGSSLVMTEQGLLPIKNLFVGKKLPSNKEYIEPSNIAISTVNGARSTNALYSKVVGQTVKIVDDEGYILRGTPNHRVLTVKPDLSISWTALEDLREGDVIVHSRKEQWLPTGAPTIKTLTPTFHEVFTRTPTHMTIELAELLGFWVANGVLSINGRLDISSHNPKVNERFVECFNKCFPDLSCTPHKRGTKVHNLFVYRFLRDCVGLHCGKAASKYIPDILFMGDRKYMDAFLRAYISCDAFIDHHTLEFCTASARLAYQLHTLISYYGARSKRSVKVSRATNGSGIYRNYHKIAVYGIDVNYVLSKIGQLYKPSKFEIPSRNERDVIPYIGDILKKLHEDNRIIYGGRRKNCYVLDGRETTITPSNILHLRFCRKGSFTASGVNMYGLEGLNWNTLESFDPALCGRLKTLTKRKYYFTKVVTKKVINKPIRVYDVSVPNGHHFISNSIVSHNTIMLSKMICDLSVKSLIIASQRDWLMGFYETFVGSNTQKALTDIDKSRIGFCKKLTDFDKYDVCLATVQTFHSESGQVLLKKLRDKFTLVGIDEVHTSSANRYIQEISRFNCKYKIGLTGTPDRKDGKYVLTEAVVGPILYEAKVERLRPTIRCVRTHFSDGSKSSVWAYIVRKVESNQARMDLIAEWALKDMAAGHMIIIPFTQVKPILKCIETINRKAGKTVAYPFYGALKKEVRDDTIQKAREYKIKIIVGNMRLLGTGINIPRCSCIYNSTLSSNIPQSQQRFSRILTPCEGKPAPMIRLFLDDIQVARSCLNNEYWNSIKKFDPIIDDKTEAILTGYLKERDRYNMWNRGGF